MVTLTATAAINDNWCVCVCVCLFCRVPARKNTTGAADDVGPGGHAIDDAAPNGAANDVQ